MRAHGQVPGPGERPAAAGALAGGLAGLFAVPVLYASGAVTRAAFAVLYCVVAVLAGILYAGIFGRAASDRRGGWLFGISYGFLIWMIGPVTLLQIITGRELVVGTAALGLLGAHLLSGLALGLLFRPMHGIVRKQLIRTAAQHAE